MITLLGVMDVNAMAKRRNDLVVSAEDLKVMAHREKIEGYRICRDAVIDYMKNTSVGVDAELFSKINNIFDMLLEQNS